ncbi:fatty acid synthase [Ramicandelaber brevisporus]|nr:fatty acid synthase [Ramicandelaber brevisporus]
MTGPHPISSSAAATSASAAVVAAAHQQAVRPLLLKAGSTEVTFMVAAGHWDAAEQLREQFLSGPDHLQPVSSSSSSPSSDDDSSSLAEIEVAARFLKFAALRARQDVQRFVAVARLVFLQFRDQFLRGNDVHSVTVSINSELGRRNVINAYFTALTILRDTSAISKESGDYPETKSALFDAVAQEKASLFAIFGGQGNVEDYFAETRELFNTYETILRPFVERMSIVLRNHAKDKAASSIHSKGMDVIRWLDNPESQPDSEYLLGAPVSLPLIGLTQLMHYYVMRVVLDMPFDLIRSSFNKGTTGHSQGIISAVVIAASSSDELFAINSEKALGLLFWIGTRSQQVFPPTTINPAIVEDSIANNEGVPMPMLSITNLRHSEVQGHVDAANQHLPADRQISIALRNGPRSFIVAGDPQSLYGLNVTLRKVKAPSGLEQSRVPYSQRKIKFSSRFLPITAPFHSNYLRQAPDLIIGDIERFSLDFNVDDVKIPVYATDDGRDLRTESNISKVLVDSICLKPLNWELCTKVSASHFVDFGVGGSSGIGSLTQRNKIGQGVHVIVASTLDGNKSHLSYRPDLFDNNPSSIKYADNWEQVYKPRLVRTLNSDGKEIIHVDTSFSRLLGKPPLMVAGMTPSTVHQKFVSAVSNAGFHVELAGGGHFNEKVLREKVDRIMELCEPGLGVSLNILFLNAFQWGFQFPLVQQMRKEGLPMEGLCCAAGVPSLENANDIVQQLKESGFRHISFKPGSIDTIRQVVSIAKSNPDMPIILQWTGGRAGGHHSFEDFHQPILETYSYIRSQPNIILVGGSGFGGVEDTLPYLTGEWSHSYDAPAMPYDGILFGSRMLVALEGMADDAAKKAIVDASGVDDAQWEMTYKGPTGGVITVRSELGEPIHKLATRGVMFWKEMDDTIFNLPRDKRLNAILAKKDYIIKKLNADFQKPWFGRKSDGTSCDLQDMTYAETLIRMVELLFVSKERRWIDFTLRDLTGDFIHRLEERFATKSSTASQLQKFVELDCPEPVVDRVLRTYPDCTKQLLTSEDAAHFVNLCRRIGQKPVPFIPVFDKDFEFWFKKDSLWQCEDLAAVVGEDIQRTCILQGPIAAKHSIRINEPAGEILGNIYQGHIDALISKYYNGDKSQIPFVEYLAPASSSLQSSSASIPRHLSLGTASTYRRYEINSDAPADQLPSVNDWLERIAGSEASWLRALLTSTVVVQGKRFQKNLLRNVLRPRPGQVVNVDLDAASGKPLRLTVSDHSNGNGGSSAKLFTAVEAEVSSDNTITFRLFEHGHSATGGEAVPLTLLFKYRPHQAYSPLHEVMDDRNERIKSFYYRLWFGISDIAELNVSRDFEFINTGEAVQSSQISAFCQTVGNRAELYVSRGQKVILAPVDFAIVVGWKSIIKAIFPRFIDGDLLRLVHLSNGFQMLDNADPLKHGDVVDTVARLNAVVNVDAGKQVEVIGTVLRDGKPVMEVTSRFLYRGDFSDYENTFQNTTETPMKVRMASAKDIAVLKSKEWIDISAQPEHVIVPGSTLIFRLTTHVEFLNRQVFASVKTTGTVQMQLSTKEFVQVATVDYECGESHGNPVIEYLRRVGQPIEQAVYFANGGYSTIPASSSSDAASSPSLVHAPTSNKPYAGVSGDFNPIHVNPYFSDLAELPGTITHGMWTSASTRKFVEIYAADNKPTRVVGYHVGFRGMVLPGDRLETRLSHVGMKNGRKIIKVETVNQDGTVVLDGTAEVDQAITAYVFTGQGSQEVGMGMALYTSSPVARDIWDQADQHYVKNYGFSILDIVRNNPKEKTVYFGGPKGVAIRRNYMSMTYDTVDETGNVTTKPLFPGIQESTYSYTFRSPNGLLSATQFTQPSLVLMERAAFADLQHQQLIRSDAPFAGHSLGEYAALAALGDVLPIDALVDVAFYRGMTMQSAVPRDAQGRSNYGMCAVNPSRVGRSFSETALRYVVDAIAHHSGGGLLEIVNYNVENWQYVVSGELSNLDALTSVLNYLKTAGVDLDKLTKTMPMEEVAAQLGKIIRGALDAAANKKTHNGGFLELERGYATIPLKGIDVPFHSSFLSSGVSPFRAYLSKKISPSSIDVALLKGRYIPNVTAQPFELTKAYISMVHEQTGSNRLARVLRTWDENNGFETPVQQQRLGYTLLVELLAYQFASAVRWIETQDRLFADFGIERLIEVGPSPTLSGMADRTLKLKYEAHDDAITHPRSTLCYSKHEKEIYYAFDPAPEPEPTPSATPAAAPPAAAPAAPAPAAAAAAPAPSAGPAAAVADAPVKAGDVLHVLVAQKLKKTLAEVPTSKAIKDLVGGKSTLQNEILGDMQKEFGNVVAEKAEEMPLDELASVLAASHSGSLGKHTTGLIARMVGAKMPGGFNLTAVRGYLNTTYGLGSGRTDGVLLLSLTMEPAARLAGEPEAKAWLDTVAQAYAKHAGISLSAGGGASGAGGAAAGPAVATINSAEFTNLVSKQDTLIRQQMEVLARYLDVDLRGSERKYEAERVASAGLQVELDLWMAEHGEVYANGIKPAFSALKARRFDSYWNWVRQDSLLLYYDILFGRLSTVDREVTAQCIHVMNRSTPEFLVYMAHKLGKTDTTKGVTYKLAQELGNMLKENCSAVLDFPPVYKDVNYPTGPRTTITPQGNVEYAEVPRHGERKLEQYVKTMATGGAVTEYSNRQHVQHQLGKIYSIIKAQNKMKSTNKLAIKSMYADVLRSLNMSTSLLKDSSPSKGRTLKRRKSTGLSAPLAAQQGASAQQAAGKSANTRETIPFLHLKKRVADSWEFSSKLTGTYIDVLEKGARDGMTFQDRTALMTGCGKNSIGAEVLRGLLSGGAKVVITTSSYSRSVLEYYQSIYQRHGSRGSVLIVVPFNQGSQQDVKSLVDYIYDAKDGLGWDLDYIIPFAAISENGREISDIDSKSELAHRLMLTNVLRLLGAVKSAKAERSIDTRPAQVILPLSPNHGTFGNDGLYSESKLGLETLFNRWHSESWAAYLTITGAIIGWTRGTGLMSANNSVAEGLEKLGVRTFSTQEMAFNILGLMQAQIMTLCQSEPVWADLNGGLQFIPNIQEVSAQLRADIKEKSETRRAVAQDSSLDYKVVHGPMTDAVYRPRKVAPRANMKFEFPELKSAEQLKHLSGNLRGMLDLDKVVVVTGYGEVGPWGNSRTRWEMEANGEFSVEGCIELAWIMGLIKHHNGPLKGGRMYAGWVDAKTNEPVEDRDIKSKYEQHILEHTGIRLIEPELFEGYDPKKKPLMREVVLEHDLEPFEVSADEAAQFRLRHGDAVDTWAVPATGQWAVRFRKGATLYVPKALRFDRLVAGQIPSGWDASRYGVPKDIIEQVDQVTLFVIVSTVEALVSSGITDPYEFYKYVHVSEVGNCSGSGIGGMRSLGKMYKDRMMDKPVQQDILQETFINTMAAWVNLLLLSSSGPIKTPVGACATAVESVEIGVETIQSGKAKVVIVGGFDDFQEEGSFEFANMKATSNADEEFAKGRTPAEMSRPATTSRAGFMEAHGAGIEILMSARVAVEMGVPIYGIVALTNTATDKEGRSVPAPGQGILTTAREVRTKTGSPLLDIKYRKRQIEQRRKQIKEWVEGEYEHLRAEIDELRADGHFADAEYTEKDLLRERTEHIQREASRQEKEALRLWGNEFYKQDARIAPLRGALASFGLTIDDIGVASFHGTSTKANDKNESDVLNKQFEHLGRSKGNACPSIFQKYLTGHPKGAAAAWMLNGVLQVLNTGIIPGNRNADNIDEVLRKFEYILYQSRSIHTDGVKAGLLKSFGFGQVGGEVLVIHPDYLFAALEEAEYAAYRSKNAARQALAYRYLHDSFTGNGTLVRIKTSPPYTPEQESQVYLNPTARAEFDAKKGTYAFKAVAGDFSVNAVESKASADMTQAILTAATTTSSVPSAESSGRGVGVDVELVSAVNIDSDTFISRNFTAAEIQYCRSRPDPQASFAGRWSAKEAVIKAVSSLNVDGEKVWTQGAAAPLIDIEVLPGDSGAPKVVLHGAAKDAVTKAGVSELKVSITHSGAYSVALAIAN